MILTLSDAPGTRPWLVPAAVASPICDNSSEGTQEAIEEIPDQSSRVIPGSVSREGKPLPLFDLVIGFSASLGSEHFSC